MPKSPPIRLHEIIPLCGRPFRAHIVDRECCRVSFRPCPDCVRGIIDRWLGPAFWDETVTEAGACRKCGEPFYDHIEFGPFTVMVSPRPDGECYETNRRLGECQAEVQILFPQRIRECQSAGQ